MKGVGWGRGTACGGLKHLRVLVELWHVGKWRSHLTVHHLSSTDMLNY